MNVGHYRHKVTLERSETVTDSYGQDTLSWSAAGTYRCLIRFITGKEAIVAQQLRASATSAVEMRYVEPGGQPITPRDRFDFGGRKLNIISVDDVFQLHMQYKIICQEIYQ